VFTQLIRATPRPLILACALALGAAYFAARFPDVPGASAGAYVSTFLIALPSAVALFSYLGRRQAALSLLALSAFGYTIETVGVVTGFPYGSFYYGDALGHKLAGLVPYLLPISYAPLVVGAVAASWGSARRPLHALAAALLLVLMDGVLDPGAVSLGFWIWPEGGPYYGVPPSNYAGWLFSGTLAASLLLSIGRWQSPPPPGLLDSAIIALSFWIGVAALSGMVLPTFLGITLSIYLLGRRSRLRAAK
jgi:bisanhydrobacterioruberin hydratase